MHKVSYFLAERFRRDINTNKAVLAIFKSFEQPSDTYLSNQHNKNVKRIYEQVHKKLTKPYFNSFC